MSVPIHVSYSCFFMMVIVMFGLGLAFNSCFIFRYPTDTDKHMLATQTGLSRNQVRLRFLPSSLRYNSLLISYDVPWHFIIYKFFLAVFFFLVHGR